MKTLFTSLILLIFFAGRDPSLLNKKIPDFSGLTLDNKRIDSTFFMGKVTVVNFWALGCRPCMRELPFLNQLDSNFHNQPFQILTIAPHSRERLSAFNSNKPSKYSNFRKAIGTEIIKVNILPECEITKKSSEDNKEHLTLLHDCEQISNLFEVDVYPTTFIIGKTGIIRHIHSGYPMEESDSAFKKQMLVEIERLLK